MKFIDKMKKDKALKDVKYVEILACPGGCVVGGGSTKPETKEAMEQRVKGIYALDAKSAMKCAAENKEAQEALNGMLHNAHEMLHTAYVHRPGF
jgi:NADH-quinone oxidoreductase subunit G